MNENEVNSKPQRAQGGKGLLSRSIHVQSLKFPSQNPNPWGEEGGREEEEEDTREERESRALSRQKERERERG